MIMISGCRYKSQDVKGVISITLVNKSAYPTDISKDFNDSIQIEYKQQDSLTQLVSRTFFFRRGKPITIKYYLINCDSVIYIKPLDDSTKSAYIDFRVKKSTHLFFSIPQRYLIGGLRYIRTEGSSNYKNKSDNLIVTYGNDLGFAFGDSLYFYFDNCTHLRKIVSNDGKILYY